MKNVQIHLKAIFTVHEQRRTAYGLGLHFKIMNVWRFVNFPVRIDAQQPTIWLMSLETLAVFPSSSFLAF